MHIEMSVVYSQVGLEIQSSNEPLSTSFLQYTAAQCNPFLSDKVSVNHVDKVSAVTKKQNTHTKKIFFPQGRTEDTILYSKEAG